MPPASLPRALQEIANVNVAEVRGGFLYTPFSWDEYGEPVVWDVSLHGIGDFENQHVNQVFLKSGRFPQAGEVVVEQSALAAMPLQLGDTITCHGNGSEPDHTFTLVGTVQTPNYPNASLLDYATMYAPTPDLLQMLARRVEIHCW